MARSKKMTVEEYRKGREDTTFITVSAVPGEGGQVHYSIVLVLDGVYFDREIADAQADHVAKTLGIKRW